MTKRMAVPGLLNAGWRGVGLVVGLVALLVLLIQAGMGARTLAAAPAPLTVQMFANQDGETVTYDVTLVNNTASDVTRIFIAGLVPSGTTFSKAVASPAGSWFRGFEAAGTAIQSAVWLSEKVPAGGRLGPFSYEVKVTGAVGLAHTWVHWLGPGDDSALSADVLARDYGLAFGRSYHRIHTVQLGLGCTACHQQGMEDADAIFSRQDVSPQAPAPVDKGICLACHRTGPGPNFYGPGAP